MRFSARNLPSYLTQDRFRTKPTHRLFDLAYYVAAHPEAADHPFGPVAYYLEVGVQAGHSPNAWFVPGPDEPGGLTDWVRARHREATARERATESRWASRPPSWDELVRRLVGRGTETEAERDRRLDTARDELAAESEFDVTIVNHEVHEAAEQLVALMKARPGA